MVPSPGHRLTSQNCRHTRAGTVFTVARVTGTRILSAVRASTGGSVTAGVRAASLRRAQGFSSGGGRTTA